MTTPEKAKVRNMIAKLWKIGNQADDMGLRLQNGADVGALIGSLASDLELIVDPQP